MNIVENSLTVVLLGDWCKLYMQPDWIAENIFNTSEIEIEMEAHGIDFSIAYKCSNVVINPSQQKVVFSCLNTSVETIEFLTRCVNNYIRKAQTPNLSAYGLNIDYTEDRSMLLSELFDDISDASAIIDLDYTITDTKLHRTIIKDNRVINIDYTQEQALTLIHFNEHYESPQKEDIIFDSETIFNYLERTKAILDKLGYEFEEDENE